MKSPRRVALFAALIAVVVVVSVSSRLIYSPRAIAAPPGTSQGDPAKPGPVVSSTSSSIAAAAAPANPAASSQPGESKTAAIALLKNKVPGVEVTLDGITGAPALISSNRGFLTGAAGEGGAVSPQVAAAIPASDPNRAIKAFLTEYRPLFGHGPEALERARVNRDYRTPHNGVHTVVWQQQLMDIPVFEAVLNANTTAKGELINVCSKFVQDLEAAQRNGHKDAVQLLAAPPVRAEKAVEIAVAQSGTTIPEARIRMEGSPQGAEQRRGFSSEGLSDVTASYVWLPTDETTLRLCWDVIYTNLKRGEMFRALVDVETGEPRVFRSLTEYISDASYRVFTSDSPTPFSPGHSTPLTAQPPAVSRILVTTPALNTTASPNGWINDGVNETMGNNVDAHTDLDANNVADIPRPQGSPARVFDFTQDLTQAPSTYRPAAVTQLFYLCNFIHDKLYELGFTEAAGNFQNSTFGRGGVGNDAVQADAQDGSGTNNANFATPPDGSPGRMQMYVFTYPTPDRDGDFDAEIVIHEYAHGLSNRLVGGGVGISALQSRGMGEGWSDFYALSLLSEAGDNVNGCYPSGGYASYQLAGLLENYYFGIRRYPYSTDFTKNPLTFKDIDPTKASPHTGVPRSTIFANTANEVHNMGEVWCVTLWEARAKLVAKYGFPAGNQMMLQLATDGMKLSPANPTYLQARDAILQADLVNNGGVNRNDLWAAFAKRGMGASAIAPASSTSTGVTESFDLPDTLGVTPFSGFDSIGTVGGPFTPASATYTLTNSGSSAISWTALPGVSWLSAVPASGVLSPSQTIPVTVSISSAAATLPAGVVSGTVSFSNLASGVVQERVCRLELEPFMIPIFSEPFESGTFASAWTVTGFGPYRTQITSQLGPHGGASHLLMDALGDGTYERNEVTLTLNLTGRHDVRLIFWARMYSDEPDGPPPSPFTNSANFDGVAISADGVTWWEVQPLRTLTDVYQKIVVDLDAAAAAHGLTYNSNFKIRFNHYDNFTAPTDGIAIDDILVAEAGSQITITLPSELQEGSAPVSGVITAAPAPLTPLTVNLNNSDASELSVPASIVIPAGVATGTFSVSVVDDPGLDGTQIVLITGSAAGYSPGIATVAVTDNETAALNLSLPAAATEGQLNVQGTVTSSLPAGSPVIVSLSSSDPANVTVPATVVIPAGQTAVTFPVSIVDDSRIDGPVSVVISATVQNWTGASASIVANDNETKSMQILFPANVCEGDGLITGTVTLGGTVMSDLVVSLASSDTSELTVPATVTVFSGNASATFSATVVDDTIPDGAQPATLFMSAPGFSGTSRPVMVADNDAHHFTLDPISDPQIRNAFFPLKITAKDANGATITNYNSNVALSATSATSGTIGFSPSVASGFVNGIWSGSAKVSTYATGIIVTAADGNGHTGSSNAFSVVVGPLKQFVWNTIGSPKHQDTPFGTVLTAVDQGGNTVGTFSGTANLSLIYPAGTARTTGSGSATWDYPLHTFYHDSRTQVIYPKSELGGAGRITSLSLYVSGLPGQTLNYWTIRIKPTAWTSYSGTNTVWESSGWTTVYQANQNITQTGWVKFNFSTPFDYDGSSNLLIDFSHNNSSWTSSGYVRATQGGTLRAIYYYTDSGFGDPLTWSGVVPSPITSPVVPDLQLGIYAPSVTVPVPPVNTGPFTGGIWAGSISIPSTGTSLVLSASDASGHGGLSNVFDVVPADVPGTSKTIFHEPFETGTLGSWWTVSGIGPFRTKVTSSYTPHSGTYHLTMDSASDGTPARNEATLTLDLSGRSGVKLSFFAKMFNDDPNGPPPSPFTNGYNFDGVAVSSDGVNWYEVQSLRSPTITNGWSQFTVDLDSAITARGLSYNSTFKIRFNQYDEFGITTDGIAIDDISVVANAPNVSGLTVPAQAMEGAGTLPGKMALTSPSGTNSIVTLSSNAPAKVSVPANVTVPAGALSASFNLNVLDDAILDGDRNVIISAVLPGGAVASGTMKVIDNDAVLLLSAPASMIEGAGMVTGTVSLGKVASAPFSITLSSNDTTELAVPATMTFAVGQTSGTFPISVVDDTIPDGTQTVTLSAGNAGWNIATRQISVANNDLLNVLLNTPPTMVEGESKNATVSIGGTQVVPITVALGSSDVAKLSVPSSVVIPVGATSGTFTLNAFDDSAVDGTKLVNVIASGEAVVSATKAVGILNNDPHHYTISNIASPQIRNAPFGITIVAKDANDLPLTTFGAAVSLNALFGSQSILTTPSATSAFTSGTWQGDVAVTQFGSGVLLKVSDSLQRTGTSNPFDVGTGPLHHFGWGTIASPQQADTWFPASISALDIGNNVVDTFSSNASIRGLASVPGPQIGNLHAWSDVPFGGWTTHDLRAQVIYLASELSGSASFSSLAFDVFYPTPGFFAKWTIRMKHTSMSAFTTGTWEGSGWTIVHQSTAMPGTEGWMTFPFSVPFEYDGVSNLMVDFSFDNPTDQQNGYVHGTNAPATRVLAGLSNSLHGSPLSWSGTNGPVPGLGGCVPNIRLTVEKAVAVRPSQSGAFSNGVWAGPVSVPFGASGVRLVAEDQAGHTGFSNMFVSGTTIVPVAARLPFFEGFEAGTLVPAWVIEGSNGLSKTKVTTANIPHSGTQHLVMDTFGSTFAVRNQATLTLDLAGYTGVVLDFWAKGFNEDSSGPPPSPFTGSADFDGVAISANGSLWYEVQPLRTLSGTWSNYVVDLDAAIAAHGLAYTPNFKIRFNRYGMNSVPDGGIAFDDISVTGAPTQRLGMSVRGRVFEGDGGVFGWVSVPELSGTDVVVALSSNAPAKLGVPASVTIPAGQSRADFDLTIFEDAVMDGTKSVVVSATASGFFGTNSIVQIQDNETSVLMVDVPDNAKEGAASVSGTLSLGGSVSGECSFTLSSSHGSQLSVPQTLKIGLGESSGTFAIAIVNDTVAEDAQAITITAKAPGWKQGVAVIDLFDDDGAVASPMLQVEPLFTGGTSNTISWSAVPGADAYEVQLANDPLFATGTASSGWVSGTNFTFGNLSHGEQYVYRARAKVTSSNAIGTWSNVVSSTQDAELPVVSVTSPAVTFSNAATLQGNASDLSGIFSLMINGTSAGTTNEFANWSTLTLPLATGTNAFTLVATDNADPPNVRTFTWNIFRIADSDGDHLPDDWETANGLNAASADGENGPMGDKDHDGISNLLERAIGTRANVADSGKAPSVTAALNPADGKRYLVFSYRHLVDAPGLTYQVQVSADLVSWRVLSASELEVLSAQPSGDPGVEIVTVRVTPSMDDDPNGSRFLSLKVTTQ